MRRRRRESALRLASSLLFLPTLSTPVLAQLAEPGCCQELVTCYDVPFVGECIPPLSNTFFPGSACNPVIGLCGPTAVCGNGIPETGEQCDDGNTVGGDGCSAVCGTEGAPIPQSGLRAEATAEWYAVGGTLSCLAGTLDPNPADPGCFDQLGGHAEGETYVLPGPREYTHDAESRARARFPGTVGSMSRGSMPSFQGVRRPPTLSTGEASRIVRYIASYTGTGTPPALVTYDIFVHFDGSMLTGRSSRVW